MRKRWTSGAVSVCVACLLLAGTVGAALIEIYSTDFATGYTEDPLDGQQGWTVTGDGTCEVTSSGPGDTWAMTLSPGDTVDIVAWHDLTWPGPGELGLVRAQIDIYIDDDGRNYFVGLGASPTVLHSHVLFENSHEGYASLWVNETYCGMLNPSYGFWTALEIENNYTAGTSDVRWNGGLVADDIALLGGTGGDFAGIALGGVGLGGDTLYSMAIKSEGAPVPEPGTIALLGAGLLGLVALRRRRRAG